MTIEDLNLFQCVVQHGSFAQAARVLDIDPSKVSRTISAMEVVLGAKLFFRTTRTLALTDAGEAYYQAIEPALLRLKEAQSMVRDLTGDVTGRLRVTTSTAFGAEKLVPLLPQWRGLHPHSEVELILTDNRVDVVESKLDLALRLGPEGEPGSEKILATKYRVCAGPGYKPRKLKEPREVEKLDCILFPYEGFRTRWLFRDQGQEVEEVQVRGRLTISNAFALRRAVEENLGPALLADWMVDDLLAQGRLIDLFPSYEVTATNFETGVWAILPPQWKLADRYRPKRIEAFLQFLKGAWKH